MSKSHTLTFEPREEDLNYTKEILTGLIFVFNLLLVIFICYAAQ